MTKRIYFALLALLLAIASACSTASPADDQGMSLKALTPPEKALPEAAALYAERQDLDKVRKALEVLESARNPDNRSFEVESAFAKYSYYLGSRKSIDDAEAEKVLKNGISAAKIALRIAPEKPDGHFWAAAILGEQSKRAPMTVGIVSVKKIRAGMQKVVEIEPGFQASSAYLGLGQLELNTRGLAGGDAEKAVEYLEKGLKESPNNAYFYAYLAEAYFAVDRGEDAKRLIRELQTMKPDPEFQPEHEDARAIADKLMKNKA